MTELRQKITTLFSLAVFGLLANLLTPASDAEAAVIPPPYIAEPSVHMVVPYPPPVEEPVIVVPPYPECPSRVVRMRVTACSPHDPKDQEYYRKNGYEGSTYGIAAYTRQFPRGTLMRVPGYLSKSYPDKFWPVDSAGGGEIRKSAAKGVPHIDVKFATLWSVMNWGSKWLDVEVIDPKAYAQWRRDVEVWEQTYGDKSR